MPDSYIRDPVTGQEKRVIDGDCEIRGQMDIAGPLRNYGLPVGGPAAVELFTKVRVPFTNTQIKSIPTDAPGIVTLLAAPGVGKWIQLLDITFLLNTLAGAYAAGLDANWAITYGADGVPASTGKIVEAILEAAAYSFIRLGPPVFVGGLSPLADLQAGSSGLVSEIENQPLLLADNSAGAAYTLGNAANTLVADFIYRVVDC